MAEDERPDGAAGDRFEIGGLLGEGGMAEVLEARDRRLDRTVAVKRLKPESAQRPDHRRRFFKEARILGGLAHPGVVPVYDAGTLETGEPFYAMEKVQGATLSQLLRARSREELGDRHDLLGLVDIFERVCQTIAYAHAGNIIHRDIKPANIMVDRYGAVLVMDWGIAKRVATEEAPHIDGQTQDGMYLGTPAYMSPEQARGASAASDFRSDVFALGVLLYQILTGDPPFAGDRPRDILEEVLHHQPDPPVKRNPKAGRELSAICMKALAKDPRRRYPTAAELSDDLRRYLEFRPVSAIRPRLVDRIGNWIRRNRILAAVLGTLLIGGLAGGAYLGLQAHLSSRLVNRIFAVVETTRSEIDLLNREAEEVAAELDRPGIGAERRRSLELRLADLEARVAVKQIDNRSRLAAIVGFNLGAPDPRAVEQLRGQTFRFIDSLVEIDDLPLARAFVLSALESYESRGNVLRYSTEEVRELRRRQAEIESMLERQGRSAR